jgi:prophage regulatory protein
MRTNTDANEDMTSTKLIRLPEVRRRVPLSRSTIYLMVSKGEFPKPVSIGTRAVAWDSNLVDAWVHAKLGGAPEEGEAA